MSNQRFTELKAFLATAGIDASLCNQLVPLNGDASFRRYYRLPLNAELYQALIAQSGVQPALDHYAGSVIVVDAPPATQKNKEFAAINGLLRDASLVVSSIYVADIEKGFFILEDLGDLLLGMATVNNPKRIGIYFKALVELLKIAMMPFSPEQSAALHARRESLSGQDKYLLFDYELKDKDYAILNALPHFDNDFMHMEMGICSEWLFDKTLHLEISAADQQMLQQSFDFIAEHCGQQTQVAMHRDYHCRNIMMIPNVTNAALLAKLAIIDYQDMVKGPLGYDLASILYDCYYKHDPKEKEMLIDFAYTTLSLSGHLPSGTSREDFDKQIRLCALQRHIKCLGLFNRLHLRDGKDAYLKDLPLVLDYVLENSSYFPELTAFADFLRQHVQGKI